MSCSSETSSAVAVAVPKGNQPAIVQFAFSDLSLHTDGLRWYAKCRHCSEQLLERKGTTSAFNK